LLNGAMNFSLAICGRKETSCKNRHLIEVLMSLKCSLNETMIGKCRVVWIRPVYAGVWELKRGIV